METQPLASSPDGGSWPRRHPAAAGQRRGGLRGRAGRRGAGARDGRTRRPVTGARRRDARLLRGGRRSSWPQIAAVAPRGGSAPSRRLARWGVGDGGSGPAGHRRNRSATACRRLAMSRGTKGLGAVEARPASYPPAHRDARRRSLRRPPRWGRRRTCPARAAEWPRRGSEAGAHTYERRLRTGTAEPQRSFGFPRPDDCAQTHGAGGRGPAGYRPFACAFAGPSSPPRGGRCVSTGPKRPPAMRSTYASRLWL
jgi:hypothetical protein